MARTKSYDRDEALQKAVLAFWEHGYGSLGVRSIEQITGLNRFAIQTDFGGKEGLFREALDRYIELTAEFLARPLMEGGLDALEAFFESLVSPEGMKGREYGCLALNTLIETASQDFPGIEDQVDRQYKIMSEAFETVLTNARDRGELRETVRIEDAVPFLQAVGMGMQATIRKTGDVSTAEGQARMAIDTVRSWRVA